MIIEARGIHKDYADNGEVVHALRGIDLTVGTGQFVSVMGPSGCGKSTLLHILGAMSRPTGGEVFLAGRSLADLSDDQLAEVRRSHVGLVFQAFNLVPVLTAEENVALPAVIAKVPPDAYRPRVEKLLEAVGLAGRRDRLPARLSGGEQQRVAIARALVMEPAVILADEPTGNLDSTTAREVLSVFQRLHAEGHTIVLATHDAKVAGLAERIVLLQDGRVRSETSTAVGDVSDLLPRIIDFGEV